MDENGIANNRNLLGKKLVDQGVITKEQLKTALEKQREDIEGGKGGLLGTKLVELEFCTSRDIAKAMAKKTDRKYMSLNTHSIDMEAANMITPEIANRYKAIPIGFTKDKEKLIVAMMNPTDIIALDDLRILTGYDIEMVIVPDNELIAAIDRFGTISSNLDDIEEEEEEEEQTVHEGEDDTVIRPAVQLANQIINNAVKAGASDVHIEPQEKRIRIRYRIDGVLTEVMNQPVKLKNTLISRFKVLGNMDIAERRIPQDGRITIKMEGKVIDIRVASLPSVYGERITLRLIDRTSRIITLSELGFPEKQLEGFKEAMTTPYGFILITGPTGSGKSTTLYATLSRISSIDKNIITVEDPVERRMEGINQIQTNNKAGLTFSSALRSILRCDPDIIMIGEIRDYETARIAVESALTGHLVFSTLHTNDAPGAVTRLADMGIEPYLTSSALIGVIAQRLVRKLCRECREKYTISRDELLKLIPDFPIDDNEKEVELYRKKGCIQCSGTGYKGRIGVYEYLNVTDEIERLILSRASANDIRALAVKQGMVTLREDGLNKVKDGISSIEEFFRVII